MKPFTKRLCIVLWALWAVIGGAVAIGWLLSSHQARGSDIGGWIGVMSVTGFILVLFQYLLTGLWRPADLLK